MAFLEMYLNGEWKNLSSFGTVSSVDIQSSSSAISVTGSPITSVGIINLSFNPSAIRLDQFAVPTSNLDINNKNLINVATPTLSHHATNKSYVDSKTWTSSSITDFSTSVTSIAKLITLDQFAVPMASLSMNNYRITSVSDPVNPQDVATKAFVQASIPTISINGAVTGTINNQGVINTLLSQYLALSGNYLNFDWTTNSADSTYSLVNNLPTLDLSPSFNILSQTGSSVTNSLRRWTMSFLQGPAGSIGYDFKLSFYHSLIAGDHTVTPFRIVYHVPDQQAWLEIKANLDVFNYKIINVPNPTASDHAANKGYIDSKTWTSSSITDFSTASTTAAKTISLDQFAIPTANINLNSNKIIGLAAPTLSTDAASKGYVDAALGTFLLPITLAGDVTGSGTTNSTITTTLNKRLDQITAPTSSVSLNSQKITSLATPTLSTDAANKSYIDSRTINDLTAPTTSFSMNNNRITNVANPISAGDVVTKSYMDALSTSKVSTTTKGAELTIDNIKIKFPSTGNQTIFVGSVSGTFTSTVSRYYFNPSSLGAGAVTFVATTTFVAPIAGDSLTADGSYYVYHIGDYTNNRFYRVTMFNAYTTTCVVLEKLI